MILNAMPHWLVDLYPSYPLISWERGAKHASPTAAQHAVMRQSYNPLQPPSSSAAAQHMPSLDAEHVAT